MMGESRRTVSIAFSARAARAYDGDACTYGQKVDVVTCSFGTSFFISGRKTKSTPSFAASDATWPRNPLAGKQNSAPLIRAAELADLLRRAAREQHRGSRGG